MAWALASGGRRAGLLAAAGLTLFGCGNPTVGVTGEPIPVGADGSGADLSGLVDVLLDAATGDAAGPANTIAGLGRA
mgnify:CR=1 FL=1